MMRKRRLLGVLAATTVVTAATGFAVMSAAQADDARSPDEPVLWSVGSLDAAEVDELTADGFDVAQQGRSDTLIVGDESVADELSDRGLEPEFHDTVYKPVSNSTNDEDTYYGGYHTVEAHEKHLDTVASDNPELAKVHDIGDSWLKQQGDDAGHDVKAICITKMEDGDCEQSPESAKPRFSLMAQIHAREIGTGEVAWKWIDKLVEGYGEDETVTELLDTTEMWVVPIANPDGVDVVASGGDNPVLHRKNVNDTDGECGDDKGIDLNRNSTFEWGDDSTDPCAETYQGAEAGSEPEVAGIEDWLRGIHPDQRDENPDDPAPDDARDVFLSLHSYGDYVIVPWGYTDDEAPNDAQLRALGEKMAESNGYEVGTGNETVGYPTSGTTDDMTYGELGVASFTFEMGGQSGDCGGFLPAYECVDSELWAKNEDALVTAAQAASAPYAG